MVKCNFCEVDLKDNELTFTCTHNICNICLSHELLLSHFKAIQKDFTILLKCPCGGELSLAVERFYALMMQSPELLNKRLCNKHNMPYDTYCKDCNIWLCEECKTSFHDEFFVAHLITDKGPHKGSKCFYHKGNEKDIFCKTCNETICESCSYEEYHSNHATFSLEAYKAKTLDKRKNLRFKTYESIEEYINDNEKKIMKEMTGKTLINKILIEKSIQTLRVLQENYIQKTDVIFRNVSNMFKVIKQCYKNYYTELKQEKIVLSSLEFISKVNQELSSVTFHPMLNDNLAKVEEALQGVTNNHFFDIDFAFKGIEVKSFDSIKAKGSVTSLCVDNTSRIICGLQTGDINIWSFKEASTIDLLGHTAAVNVLSLIKVGTEDKLCSGSSDNSIRIWSLNKGGGCIDQFNKMHTGSIWEIIQLSDGRIASSSSDNTIKVWAISSPNDAIVIKDNTKFESCMCLVDENSFASGSGDSRVKIWNNLTGFIIGYFIGHMDYISCLIQLGEGIIASGSADATICIWNSLNKSNKKLYGHTATIQKLIAMTPERIISCSIDKTIRVWCVNELTCLNIVNDAHKSTIYGMGKINNTQFATGGNDKTINVWEIPE